MLSTGEFVRVLLFSKMCAINIFIKKSIIIRLLVDH